MATDQQLRARFLEESAEYFEQMEQALLSLPDAEKPAQQIDVAMRAAHSLKGGAGMMGFHPMAQIAHRLEDFLKIIRARRVEVDTDLETLLLQGLDSLKDVRLQLSSGFTVDDDWIALYVDPIVAQLKGRLGELSEDDENRLLSETEDVDVAVLVFNVGVEEALDTFETSRDRYEGESLREALCEQAMRLSELGLMGGIDAFVSLCQSVYEQAQVLSLEQIPVFCDQALTAWKRSQSLVQLGRTGKLPTQLSFIPKITTLEQTNANAFSVAEWDATPSPATSTPVADIEIEPPSLTEGFDLSLDTEGFDLSLDSEALESLQTEIAAAVNTESPSLTEGFDLSLNSEALESWQTEMAVATAEALASQPDSMAGTPIAKVFRPMAKNPLEMETLVSGATVTEQKTERLAVDSPGLDSPELDSPELDSPELDLSGLDLSELDSNDLSQLQTAFDQIEIAATPDTSEPEKGIEQLDKAVLVDEVTPPEPSEVALWSNRPETKQQTVLPQRGVSPGRTGTLRIAAEELQHINSLFGTLILERNAINLRQEQLDSFAALLHERMQALEAFNVRLRQWYDRASMESLLPTGTTPAGMPVAIAKSRSSQDASISSLSQDFDALEMDQYSELHLMAQEQMETVVKLQEVTADIRLGLREMGQATQSLNSTTRQLQNRITRTQMRPFSYVVGRFPRLIRDLSVQYGKKVQLKVEGETTLFERLALDLLADPLTHILRNSFDHGIESNDERVKAGKPAIGLITMRASQLGNRARITVRDDGRGINLDKIRDRMRQHRIDEAVITKLSKQDLLSVIFDAGFSTADKVTELSGRGVGMDVVRTNLQQLGGDIQVDTQLGQGTVFTIDIPLSLSVLRIMLLEQQSLVFAVPVNAIEELTAFDPQQIIPSEDGPKLAWQGQQIPWITLENHLTFNGSAALTSLEGKPTIDHPMALIVSHDNGYYAIAIQRYWGEQEVATRPITSPLPLPAGYVGATVLGDGRVVPLVDLPLIVSSHVLDNVAKQTETVNVAQQTKPETETVASKFSPALHQQPTQNRVLVVDDSVHVRRYLTLSLEKAGYYVEEARDGQEAVDKLLGGLKVQTVLCDVEMPRLDGYGVLEEIKIRPEFESLPIAMLTSRSSEKHRKLAMNLGASAYFAKPYNEQELLKTLAKLITEADQIRSSQLTANSPC